ncbi:MAG: serine hydrolase domain-containing protein [Flavobacteriaceae bacterium]
MKKFFLIALLITVLASCAKSFKQDIKITKPIASFVGQVDSIVISKMNQYNIPGLAIGIVKDGKIVYTNGFGVKNINKIDPVTENSVFHVASISKLLTAQAIVQLEMNNRLRLDDKLIDLIPELNFSDESVKSITIKSLLNHTSGLPDISNYHWSNHNQAENSLKDYILELNSKLDSEPSTKYQYSNLGYDILGYVVEKVTRNSFEDFVKEQILNTSGMNASDFRYFKIPDSLKTTPHTKTWIGRNITTRETYPYTREHAPSSTLNTSSKELSNWMISFLDKLENSNPKNNYSSMLESSTGLSSTIGLGFQLYDIDAKKAVGHYGGDKGFRSFLMMIPNEHIGVVLLANCDYNEDYRQEIVYPIVRLLLRVK